jgi:arylsulfatase A-like enzyme
MKQPLSVYAAVLFAFLGMIASPSWAAQAEPAGRRPNIVVIVADDLGYADLGCQGCKDIPTPHIDSIAQHGIRFTNGYVSCPVCSPTRAGLMTGRYQQRFGHEFNLGSVQKAADNFGLPLTEKTLPQLLKAAGYATGMVGKWHLGYRPEYHPQKRGFDEFFGFLSGSHPYLDARKQSNNPIVRGTQPVDEKEYLTDAFAREAVAFIGRHQKEPFFLYFAPNAVHAPLQAVAKYRDRFPNLKDEKRHTYAAMLSALDDAVGQVLGRLRAAGLEENTLVFFISDNGGPTPVTSSRNDPLRGTKGTVWEGGIRVPFLLQWKGKLPAGKVYDYPVIALDILPTSLAAAGVKPPPGTQLDGVDLLPYLSGRNSARPHETLYWRFGVQRAMRKGDLKLVWLDDRPPQLYDLATDIGEQKDLAASRPEVVKSLQDEYARWNAQLMKPLWGPPSK